MEAIGQSHQDFLVPLEYIPELSPGAGFREEAFELRNSFPCAASVNCCLPFPLGRPAEHSALADPLGASPKHPRGIQGSNTVSAER